ncbi:MAG: hypothetical protein GF347_03340 [Candidatus Moranbacteria bacterium]|nr:hypothetical protein [Candidatus Moranbacteria bacterium]
MGFEKQNVEITNPWEEYRSVETEKGSVYTYLADGRTQRFKKVEGKKYEPQDALVFIPNYDRLKQIAPPEINFEGTFGENEVQYNQILLHGIRDKGQKNYIVDQKGRKLETNHAIANTKGPIFLTFGDSQKVDFHIPITNKPRMGFYTYDTRKYQEKGETLREKHMGNKVVKIEKR